VVYNYSKLLYEIGVNNMVWYFQWLDIKGNKVLKGGKLVQKKDYMGQIKLLLVNDYYAAILSDGKCTLHLIDSSS
jgi:hypothetical protein